MISSRAATLLLAAAYLATLPLLVGTTFAGFTWLVVPAVALSLIAAHLTRWIRQASPVVPFFFLASAAFGAYSILSGTLNGLSDEPYSTPAYAGLGLGMYSHPVAFSYVQYGRTYFENSYDVYLPLLTFVQVPGLDYRWVALGAWAGTLYLVRRDRFASVGWAAPWVVVLAANGQNDFVPLAMVSVALLRRPPAVGWVTEVVALGLKQFANVLVFSYHVVRREYVRAGASIAITFALLLPFLLADPGGVWCHVIVGDPGTSCHGHPWTFFVFKRNYWLYPTWVALIFHDPLLGWLRRRWPA